MRNVVRNILAVIVGFVAASAVMMLMESIWLIVLLQIILELQLLP